MGCSSWFTKEPGNNNKQWVKKMKGLYLNQEVWVCTGSVSCPARIAGIAQKRHEGKIDTKVRVKFEDRFGRTISEMVELNQITPLHTDSMFV